MKMKSILKEWKNFQLNEMSRLYGEDPANFPEDSVSRSANISKKLRTKLNPTEFVLELYELVKNNDNLFISFSDIDFLGVSPKIRFNTPHGIYGYPFKMDNLFRYLETGYPTGAQFAGDRKYFHVYKIKDDNSIKIESDFSTNYDDRNYSKDLKSMIQMFLNYISSSFASSEDELNPRLPENRTKVFSRYSSIQQAFNEFFPRKINYNAKNQIVFMSPQLSDLIISLYYNGFFGETRISKEDDISPDWVYVPPDVSKDFDNVVNYFMRIFNNFASGETNKFYERIKHSKFYKLYFIAYFCSDIISNMNYSNKSISIKPGAIFTMLLSSAGIMSIDDSKGTSTLHRSEPSQAVIFDISKSDRYELLGTYNNLNAENVSRETFKEVIISEVEKGNIDARDTNAHRPSKSSSPKSYQLSDEKLAFLEASTQLQDYFQTNSGKINIEIKKYAEEIFNLYTPNDIDHFSEEAANILRDDFFAENAQLLDSYINTQFKGKLLQKYFELIQESMYNELSRDVSAIMTSAHNRLKTRMLSQKGIPSQKSKELLKDVDYWRLTWSFDKIRKFCHEDMLINEDTNEILKEKFNVSPAWIMKIDS